MPKIIGIFGHGGFARELKCHILKTNINTQILNLTDNIHNKQDFRTRYDIKNIDTLIAIGDPSVRKQIYYQHEYFNYTKYICETSNLLDLSTIEIKPGSIICAGSILTTNIKLGLCNIINLNCTIGHDCNFGDFITCSPGVNISGNCTIGNNVLVGTNSAVKEYVNICDNVIIGMNSNVVKHITEPGIYIGNPLRKLK